MSLLEKKCLSYKMFYWTTHVIELMLYIFPSKLKFRVSLTILILVPHIPESMASTGSYRYFDDEDEDDLEGIL